MEHDIKQRIKTILKVKGISINILSKELGIPQNSLNRQINSETTLSANTILSIIGYFNDLSSDWLITGNGEMLKPQQQQGINNKYEGSFSGGAFVGGHGIGDINAPVKTGDIISGNGIKGNGNYAGEKLNTLKREIDALKLRIESLNVLIESKERIIGEKERLIQILLERK